METNREHMRLEMESLSRNEEFARVVTAVFMSRLDPVSYTHLDVYKRQGFPGEEDAGGSRVPVP